MRLKYFGDYELLDEIARGGMGVVWKARQSSLNRRVALKMIRAGSLASKAEVDRFLREAEAAANLQHPNIVAIHEVGEHGGQHYFSMDYVEGRDLGSLVKEGPLSPQVAARYVKIIAEAIHFAHQRGTLHRDLKPQNVLIDAADQPRITDFGLAKIMNDDSQLTQTGVVMGSPSYMPPEQAAGRHDDIGPASDVYSLGAMLYELLTGRPPFRGATAMDTLHQVMEAEPVSPRWVKRDVPPDLETICLKCLRKSPMARYPSAQALADELDRYLKGEPIQARPASTARKIYRWARQHPGLLSALATFIMVGLSFGLYYLIEENAFLRAKLDDPGLVRAFGSRHDDLEVVKTIHSFAVSFGIFLFVVVTARSRGGKLRDLFDPAIRTRPPQPLDERTRAFALYGGLIVVACGVMFLVKLIQAHVWEGESILSQIFIIYASVYFGLANIGAVIRDQRMVHYGVASRKLTEEQLEPIRNALEDFNVGKAAKLYRQAVPDAGTSEAMNYVIRLAESLRAKHPGKFVPPPLSLDTLNGKVMLICAAIEAVVFGVVWLLWMPANPAAFLSQFAFGLLLGLGMLAGTRVKGFGKRMLLMVPAFAAIILSEAFGISSAGSRSPLAYLGGLFFGIFLMISAFTPRRR